ncbi:peroxisome assembly protein 12 [Dendroctonus ponderosae]|uniref:Peroxisome assembly protein 12 n=1 Tax=Dendroctonus ponderosae TaxID=77166 RepID=J3JYU8_DENPD|nr:peroxisome assembly protein 12 [Dendroctonus ponderosae]AEE63386.1 unknown [Dendroctonus ponderosae]ERL85755.1 hypothetical protein D910_03170 [Dendroctonus ponderosae]KAH1018006.1 hypothetical protein HUJ05_005844 [Dendroctonus ponderosae]
MIENAANFTRTYQIKPSIFEVLAQQSLTDTLYPALQKVALFLSAKFPEKLGFLDAYYNEAFLALSGLLQFYYLKNHDGSFSENFYGLKRVLVDDEPLKHHEKELSLIFLVLMPYFKRKIEDKIQMYRIECAEGCIRNDFERRSKQIVIRSHSAFEVAWSLLALNNHLQYMAGKTEYPQPLLNLLKLKLVYSNEEPSLSFWGQVFKGNLRFSDISGGLLRNAASTVLETTAFFLQFLQTWSAQKPNCSITDLPKIEAPTPDNRARAYGGKCPLCLQTWRIPTALPVSGYIFCFRCILKHLSEAQKCPVTNLPAKPLDIVRLYPNE